MLSRRFTVLPAAFAAPLLVQFLVQFLVPLLVPFVSVANAGSLTPPGAPAPTMKTLDEVEARIPVGPLTTPGDADSVFRISQPGSYYLTADVAGVANSHGIEIDAADVTLDLNGYTLRGVPNSLDGVNIGFGIANVTVRNGTLRDWGNTGMLVDANAVSLSDLHFASNRFWGLAIGVATGPHLVQRCTAFANGDAAFPDNTGGLLIAGAATVTDCAVRGGQTGILIAGRAVVLERCVVDVASANGFFINAFSDATLRDCSATTSSGNGFEIRRGSTVTLANCVASQNTVGFRANDPDQASPFFGTTITMRDCSADRNTSDGYQLINATMNLQGCAATDNGDDGFSVSGGLEDAGRNATFSNCISTSNAGDGFFIGTRASLVDCRSVDDAGFGIFLQFSSEAYRCRVDNSGGIGFVTGAASRLVDCSVSLAQSSGVQLGSSSTMTGGSVTGTVGFSGISIGVDSVVKGVYVGANAQHGVSMQTRAVLEDATLVDNGIADVLLADSFTVDGDDCIIRNCDFRGSPVGIDLNGQLRALIDGNTFRDYGGTNTIILALNLDAAVIRNTFYDGATISIFGGNNVAPILAPNASSSSAFSNLGF